MGELYPEHVFYIITQDELQGLKKGFLWFHTRGSVVYGGLGVEANQKESCTVFDLA